MKIKIKSMIINSEILYNKMRLKVNYTTIGIPPRIAFLLSKTDFLLHELNNNC